MARQTPVATAASQRKPRSTSRVTKKAKHTTKAASNCVEKKRKTRGRQTEAAKARKRKEVTKAKKFLIKQANNEGSSGNQNTPKKAPKPTNVFNDELKSYDLEYEAEEIVDSKIEKKKRLYLVKWVGWPESANTWEPEVNLRNSLDLIAEFDQQNPTKP